VRAHSPFFGNESDGAGFDQMPVANAGGTTRPHRIFVNGSHEVKFYISKIVDPMAIQAYYLGGQWNLPLASKRKPPSG
jgi:hypothetical protein